MTYLCWMRPDTQHIRIVKSRYAVLQLDNARQKKNLFISNVHTHMHTYAAYTCKIKSKQRNALRDETATAFHKSRNVLTMFGMLFNTFIVTFNWCLAHIFTSILCFFRTYPSFLEKALQPTIPKKQRVRRRAQNQWKDYYNVLYADGQILELQFSRRNEYIFCKCTLAHVHCSLICNLVNNGWRCDQFVCFKQTFSQYFSSPSVVKTRDGSRASCAEPESSKMYIKCKQQIIKNMQIIHTNHLMMLRIIE